MSYRVWNDQFHVLIDRADEVLEQEILDMGVVGTRGVRLGADLTMRTDRCVRLLVFQYVDDDLHPDPSNSASRRSVPHQMPYKGRRQTEWRAYRKHDVRERDVPPSDAGSRICQENVTCTVLNRLTCARDRSRQSSF